jgi:molybdopterin-guanine dinucleotide biosynthesis protein A
VTSRVGAVVLTGGTAARMGGVDKASLELAGVTLLERALAATADAAEVVVVGEPVATSRPVTWAREDPPGGGPAAGLLAGLDAFRDPPELVQVLAVDMPQASAETFARLLDAVDQTSDGALLVDAAGRRQLLCAVYRCSSLRRVRPADPEDEHGLAVRRLLGPLTLAEVPATGEEARDVDTWGDLRRLQESLPDEGRT